MQTESAGNGNKNTGGLDPAEFAEIEKTVAEVQAARKKFKPVNLVLTLAIVLVFVIFGLLYYSTVKQNFTEKKLLESLRENAREISPELSDHAAEVIADAGPEYSRLAQERLPVVMPKWVTSGKEELKKVSDNIGKIAETEVQDALYASIRKSKIKEALPELTDSQIENLRMKLEKRIRADMQNITGHILKRTEKEIFKISNTLDNFDLTGLPNDEDGLSRLIAHDLLMLLDKQIMEGK